MPKLETPNLDRALNYYSIDGGIRMYCSPKNVGESYIPIMNLGRQQFLEELEKHFPKAFNSDINKIAYELKKQEHFCRGISSDKKKIESCKEKATKIDAVKKWRDYGCDAEKIYLFFDFK